MKLVPPEKRCVKQVPSDGTYFHYHRCTRFGVLEHDGKLWCRQHHPPTVKAQDVVRRKQRERELDERNRKQAEPYRVQGEIERKSAAYDRLIAALDYRHGAGGHVWSEGEIRAILEGKAV